MFDENFISNLPNNPQIAGKKILDTFKDLDKSFDTLKKKWENYEEYLKALSILRAFAETHMINLKYPVISSNTNDNINSICEFFTNAGGIFDQRFTDGTSDLYKSLFRQKYGMGFFYEFSDGDLKRIQTLINELREMILKTGEIADDHKSRLLKKLERLQSELYKRVSDLDRFWGLLFEASIVLKKVGENAKPIVDRILEIANIIWRVQARAEELPSNTPLELPSGAKGE